MLINPFILAVVGGGGATTVFHDTFTGAAGDIDGHVPEVFPSGFVWSGSAGTISLTGAGAIKQTDLEVAGFAGSSTFSAISVDGDGYRATMQAKIDIIDSMGASAQYGILVAGGANITIAFEDDGSLMAVRVVGTDLDAIDFEQTGEQFTRDTNVHTFELTVSPGNWALTFNGDPYLTGTDDLSANIETLTVFMVGGVSGSAASGNSTLHIEDLLLETL